MLRLVLGYGNACGVALEPESREGGGYPPPPSSDSLGGVGGGGWKRGLQGPEAHFHYRI